MAQRAFCLLLEIAMSSRSEREADKMATRENNRMLTDVCCFDTFVSNMTLVKYISDCILPYFLYLSRHVFITDNSVLCIFGSKSDGQWVGYYSQQQESRRVQPESKTQRLDNIFMCSIKWRHGFAEISFELSPEKLSETRLRTRIRTSSEFAVSPERALR